jgi:hypothetical protein
MVDVGARWLVSDARAMNDAVEELDRARGLHGRFASAHEGYGVITEEWRELETEVFKRKSQRDQSKLRHEAIQLAAAALKFASDIETWFQTRP